MGRWDGRGWGPGVGGWGEKRGQQGTLSIMAQRNGGGDARVMEVTCRDIVVKCQQSNIMRGVPTLIFETLYLASDYKKRYLSVINVSQKHPLSFVLGWFGHTATGQVRQPVISLILHDAPIMSHAHLFCVPAAAAAGVVLRSDLLGSRSP